MTLWNIFGVTLIVIYYKIIFDLLRAKKNGWQRIGIILSVVIATLFSFVEYIGYCSIVRKDLADTYAGAFFACSVDKLCQKIAHAKYISDMNATTTDFIIDVLVFFPVLLALLWGGSYCLVWLGQWVATGFRQKNAATTLASNIDCSKVVQFPKEAS